MIQKACQVRFVFVGAIVSGLTEVLDQRTMPVEYDVVMTSPPYGDSRTTVQYGGISSLCLGIIRQIPQLRLEPMTTADIDSRGLGGAQLERPTESEVVASIEYWKGSKDSPHAPRVRSYLLDVEAAFAECARLTRPGGVGVWVVGRRMVGGRRLVSTRFWRIKLSAMG